MKRLTANASSHYIEAANRLRPRSAARKVVAYVESYDDISFWRSVLDEFESDKLHFEVMLPSRTTLVRGKKNVLNNELGERLGNYMIACVDADYDWLMQGRGECSHMLLTNPHVFHTYVYAIENFQSYAPALHEACAMATLNDRAVMDFEAFMREYSEIIWPLFIWSVWVYRHGCYSEFSLIDFCSEVTFHDINPNHPENALVSVRKRVNRYVSVMQRRHPEARNTYVPLKKELLALGLTQQTTYLYMQGHRLMEGVVLPLLEPICALLRKERENEISKLACHEVQRQNELSCYRNSQTPVSLMLRKGTGFKRSEPYARLREDLRKFVDNLGD